MVTKCNIGIAMAKGAMKELQWWKMFQRNVARTKFSHFLKVNLQSLQMIFFRSPHSYLDCIVL
jgi:hypothetical protein